VTSAREREHDRLPNLDDRLRPDAARCRTPRAKDHRVRRAGLSLSATLIVGMTVPTASMRTTPSSSTDLENRYVDHHVGSVAGVEQAPVGASAVAHWAVVFNVLIDDREARHSWRYRLARSMARSRRIVEIAEQRDC